MMNFQTKMPDKTRGRVFVVKPKTISDQYDPVVQEQKTRDYLATQEAQESFESHPADVQHTIRDNRGVVELVMRPDSMIARELSQIMKQVKITRYRIVRR